MKLNSKVIEKIYHHALQEYPYECCGIITGDSKNQTVHRCENIQNRLHVEDPARYPGDARISYIIDRSEFDKVISSAKEKDEGILAFYHSHPEHEAYFSEEDVAAQTVFGEPEFPDVLQIVVSVMNGKIHDIKCFAWDVDSRTFIKIRENFY
jgi:proteasome lid subunit RPN8/RPN11